MRSVGFEWAVPFGFLPRLEHVPAFQVRVLPGKHYGFAIRTGRPVEVVLRVLL